MTSSKIEQPNCTASDFRHLLRFSCPTFLQDLAKRIGMPRVEYQLLAADYQGQENECDLATKYYSSRTQIQAQKRLARARFLSLYHHQKVLTPTISKMIQILFWLLVGCLMLTRFF